MAYSKICPHCQARLDPGERCDCDSRDQPEKELARRPAAKKKTVYPREYNSQEYINARWQEFYER